MLRILASGSTRRGAAIAAQTCAACHGDKGLSQAQFPALAGQTPAAIYKQLHDYRSGARVNPQMTPVAKALAVTDLANVAAYYAAEAQGLSRRLASAISRASWRSRNWRAKATAGAASRPA